MKLARWSLFYLVSYLLGAGLSLLASPHLVFTLLGSTQADSYGDVIPRMVGALACSLGLIVVQIIRLRLEVLYVTLIVVRVFLVGVWFWLYALTHDPFFLVLAAIVGFGMLLTAAGVLQSRRSASPS